jgi:sulfite exporter TauE/SafE
MIGLDAIDSAPIAAFCGIVTALLLFLSGLRKTLSRSQVEDLIATVDYLRRELDIARAEIARMRDSEDAPR